MKTATKLVILSVVAALLACGPEKKAKKENALPGAPEGDVTLPPSPPPVTTSGSAQVFISKGEDAWINQDTGVSWSVGMRVVNDRVHYDQAVKEGHLTFSGALVERNSLGNLDVSGFRKANYCDPKAYLFTRENLSVYAPGSEWDMREAKIFLKTGNGEPVEVGRFQKPDPTMTEYTKLLLAGKPVVCEEEYSSVCRLVTRLHGPVKTPLSDRKQAELSLLLTNGGAEAVALTTKTVLGMDDYNDSQAGCRSVQ